MTASHENETSGHFKDKDAIGHVIEAQAQGIISAAEIHGVEIPGHISAGADAARDMAVVLLLVWALLLAVPVSPHLTIWLLAIIGCGWAFWKAGRSAWIGWSRLERLHRVLEQERWEIVHHRHQEREELKVLYAAKGLEGRLLEDVLDVLMADDNRLLRVMVEEELGLSLESQEHPLKQGLGAFLGALSAGILCIGAIWLYPHFGLPIGALLAICLSSIVSAQFTQNRWIPAIVWNSGLGLLALGCTYFLLEYLFGRITS